MSTHTTNEKQNPLVSGVVAGAMIGAALAGFNHLAEMAADAPTPVLGGEQRSYAWRLGRIFYHVGGEEDAPPMVLIHSLHAAASGYEWRHNFDFFVERGFRVYVPDLLGFGLSDRPAMAYDDEVFIALIGDFLRDVVQQPAVVMATSVSAAFAIAAAARHPERIAKLVLMVPVGVSQRKTKAPGLTPALNSAFSSKVLGEGLFNLLTTPGNIRKFLAQDGFYRADLITDEMVEHHYNLAHMPNAHYAPAAFISGLTNRDVTNEWASLRMPLLLVWGYHGKTTPPSKGTEFLKINPRAATNGYDAKLLPHDECAEQFNIDTLAWLEGRRKE
jgi:pimeloyl-ACP methyl ester carboxylesterase